MYRGFNLRISDDAIPEDFYDLGETIHTAQRTIVQTKLEQFLTPGGELDASKVQENWFPKTDSHVFISHSHRNERLALKLAGWLNKEFRIISFIDSCAWGYCGKLQRILDNKYCDNGDGSTYNYEKRNRSTSHVNVMLSTALMKMIDKAECLLFLNTPESITPKKVIDPTSGTTKSPWIYAEIAITQLIQKKDRDEHRGIIKKATEALAKAERFDMLWDLKLAHLAELSVSDLIEWQDEWSKLPAYTAHDALDLLYDLNPLGPIHLTG